MHLCIISLYFCSCQVEIMNAKTGWKVKVSIKMKLSSTVTYFGMKASITNCTSLYWFYTQSDQYQYVNGNFLKTLCTTKIILQSNCQFAVVEIILTTSELPPLHDVVKRDNWQFIKTDTNAKNTRNHCICDYREMLNVVAPEWDWAATWCCLHPGLTAPPCTTLCGWIAMD